MCHSHDASNKHADRRKNPLKGHLVLTVAQKKRYTLPVAELACGNAVEIADT